MSAAVRNILQEIKIKAKGAAFFPPATDSKIDFANAMLKNEGIAAVPYDYAEFLKTTNGLIAPGVEFYGTGEAERGGHNYKFPGLVGANREAIADGNPLLKGCVLVGNAFLHAIIFDAAEQSYRMANRPGFATARKFPSMAETLRHILGIL